MRTRIEHDTLGPIEVPHDVYWGAQTQRSIDNFPIGTGASDVSTGRMPRSIIYGIARTKREAALANARLAGLDERIASAIVTASEEVLAGQHDDQFPLAIFQTGSGTQTNMNVNEVVANRASELLGIDFRDPDAEGRVKPNDHVNRSQSSNDVFPTAMHVAAATRILEHTLPALQHLRDALHERAEAYADLVKTGRTHLMDATPVTLGQELSGYAAQLDHGIACVRGALPRLCALAIGGTATGTGLNAPDGFAEAVVAGLSEQTGVDFTVAANRFEALSAHDAVVEMSGALKRVAVSLLHIGNNIRLLASGPRTGLAEIILPENEPGSSIMPGKVNPTQCEALTMVAAQVIGNDATITVAGTHGQLQLNVFKPVMAANLLHSAELLGDACRSFADRCVVGLRANEPRIAELLERSLMLVTALAPELGYYTAAEIAQHAHQEGLTLEEAATGLGHLSAERFRELVDPASMV